MSLSHLAALRQGSADFSPAVNAVWHWVAKSLITLGFFFFISQFFCVRSEGKIISLNIVTLRNFNSIHLESSNVETSASGAATKSLPWWQRRRKKWNNFPCVFYIKLLPSEPLACARPTTGWRNLAGEEITLQHNRYWDTGRQLYFNLLGEYTNNQFRLWRKVAAAFLFLLFTAIHRCWSWVRKQKKVCLWSCHMLRSWMEGRLKLPLTSHLHIDASKNDASKFFCTSVVCSRRVTLKFSRASAKWFTDDVNLRGMKPFGKFIIIKKWLKDGAKRCY